MRYLNDSDLCLEIAQMCRDPNRRIVGQWEQRHPSRWWPNTVRNARTGENFTEGEAWEQIATLIEEGHALRITELTMPPGNEAFELIVPTNGADLYIKIALSKTKKRVIGRSFHYSDK
jgi:hypothetical protein